MTMFDINILSSTIGVITALAIAIGAYAVGQYRIGRMESDVEKNRIAHESEVKDLKGRIDRMESERSTNHAAIMKELGDLKGDLGNRLTAIETTLKIKRNDHEL